MLDVEGRQMQQRFGVKRVVAAERGGLKFSEFGLAPQEKHTGAAPDVRPSMRHFEVKYSETEVPRGKKHIEMVHQQPLEIQKRMAGKIGLRKLKPPTHPEPATRTRPSVNSQTCEQRAKAALEKAVHEDPSVAPTVERAFAQNSAAALIEAEKKVYRQLALNRAKEWHQAEPEKVANRNPPSSQSSLQTPYATSNEVASPPQHHHRKPVPAPKRTEPRHEGVAVSANRGRQDPIPFDTKFSCPDYPEPPAVGVTTTGQHRRGKQLAEPRIDKRDEDELALKRAAARRPNTSGGMPDFLYGDVPPPQPKRIRAAPGPSSIPCGDLPVRNRAIDPSKYRPTALW